MQGGEIWNRIKNVMSDTEKYKSRHMPDFDGLWILQV